MASNVVSIKSYLKCTPFGTYLRRRRWNKQITNVQSISKVVDKYTEGALTWEERQEIIEDILMMARKYRFSADEYFYYHFREKAEDERKLFCSDLNRIDIVEGLNMAKNLSIFNDKMRTYDYFKAFYGRDLCGITGIRDLDSFTEFSGKHSRFIVKPTDSSCGQGIILVDLKLCDNVPDKLTKLIELYCAGGNGGFVAEELILQDPRMASLYSHSVNTVRITTIRCDDGIEILPPFLKIGRNGSIVDNAGAGGVFGAIDMETGEVLAVADKLGNYYSTHPDTGVALKGFVVPRWEEAKELAKKLAMIVPDNRYTGWDLALTEHGWVMVEGNARGQFVGWQISLQQGYMDEINRILKRLRRNKITKIGI